ncbi:hypothetical protein BG000_011349 [Podila horticola]|nr:hypothetical protein BG000_011349 [Podila horticola]
MSTKAWGAASKSYLFASRRKLIHILLNKVKDNHATNPDALANHMMQVADTATTRPYAFIISSTASRDSPLMLSKVALQVLSLLGRVMACGLISVYSGQEHHGIRNLYQVIDKHIMIRDVVVLDFIEGK